MSGETPEVTLLRGLAGTARGPRREGVFALWLTTRAALDLLMVPPPAERSHRRRITALERRLATLTLPPPLRRALNASLTQLRTSSPESALEALTQLIAPARESGGPDAGEALAAAARAAREVLRTRKAQGVAMYQRVRRSRGAALLVLPALATALAGLGPFLATRISWTHVIPDHTAGIVTPDLAWGILAAFPLVGIMLYSAAIEPDDAGLDAGRLLGGLGMVVMLWAASQVIGALPRVVAEQGILPHPDLMNRPFLVARRALAPLPGAFRDGLVFRGFLLPQLYLLFHRDSAAPRLQGLGRALVISQLLALLPPLAAGWAGLSHLGAPALIQQAGLLLGLALFLAWIYIRTGNLFFTMGVHLLVLSPIPLFAPMIGKGPWIQQAMVVILAVVWTALWKGEK